MIRHLGKTIHENGIVVEGSIDMRNGVITNLNKLSLNKWSLELNENGELCINHDKEVKARITNNNEITINLNCERYFMVQPINVDKCIGLVVSNLPRYYNMDITQRPSTQALPSIYLSNKPYDSTVIGVIVSYEKYERTITTGNIESVSQQEDDLNRVLVASQGTAAIWVCDVNGSFLNGDYITTSGIPGYGMRQDDDIKHNYTLSKITQNCDFQPGILILEKPVDFDEEGPVYEQIRSINNDVISDVEYESRYVNIDGKEVSVRDFVNDLQKLAGDDDIYISGKDIRLDLLTHPERSIFRAAKVGCIFN